MNLLPRVDQRAMIAGCTGSGKTFFATWMLEGINGRMARFVFDLKGDDQLTMPGCIVCYDTQSAYKNVGTRDVLYRPAYEDSPEELDDMLEYIYQLGNICTYIDELGRFVENNPRPRKGLMDVLGRGRKRSRNGQAIYSPLIWATQAPSYIPLSCYRETECFYMFHLRLPEDRQRVAGFTDPTFKINPSQDYGFRHLRPGMKEGIEYGPVKTRTLSLVG